MNILSFIELIKTSFIGAKTVYTEGSCYNFYLILSSVFEDCKPYYDELEGHVLTKYKDKYYDITGEVSEGTFYEEKYIKPFDKNRLSDVMTNKYNIFTDSLNKSRMLLNTIKFDIKDL